MDSARARPIWFFCREVLRHAAIMALCLTVGDFLVPTHTTFVGSPDRRIFFITAWAAWMGLFYLVLARRAASPPP